MTDKILQTNTDTTFYAAEQTGLRLAIKGRLIAVCVLCLLLAISRGPERAADFALAALIFAALGILHYLIIGSTLDRRWAKYVFFSIDILLLSFAVAFVTPTPEVQLDQIFMFRFDTFPFYFIILGVAAFSFSPGLVLWSGIFGAGAWMGSFLWVTSKMQNRLEWSDIPDSPTKEQFLGVFLSEEFAGTGSRIQEAVIFMAVAILIAIVMHRARQTVWRQLEAERDMTAVSQMFGRFVPKSVAEIMIKDKGALDPVERQATVLFTDLTEFTKLTEAKGPRAIVDILNAYFDAATEIIGKNNGVVTQFQGDAILAIFNVPFEDEDHAQHAFDSATELLKTVRDKLFAGEKLAIRIGLNSGPLIAGNVGGGGRQSYTVHGNAVNLAARLENLNKQYGTSLLVSESTADLLLHSDLRKIGETEIRGMSEPIDVYALSNESENA
jgi:adenylate cyclase